MHGLIIFAQFLILDIKSE